jgi:hypothetical protein
MKAQPPEPLDYTKRHGQLTAQYAIRDVYDALEELITNSDDSYLRIDKPDGQILIEVEHRYKGNSKIIVRDRAEGMTLDEMRKKIKKVGDFISGGEGRGFMGRGAKDCAALGKVTFESIKDNYYHKCEVLPSMEFLPYAPSAKATEEIRKKLGIPRGNGTVVTIEVNQNIKVPRHETLLSELPKLFALRDIMHKDSDRKVLLRNLNENTLDPLVYNDPPHEKVIEERFEIPNYPGATAHLVICKTPDLLEDLPDKRFRRIGFLIKGERAIHEITLFTNEFENDQYAHSYFGKLTCPFIDTLCNEYDKRRENRQPHPENNPNLLIDPNRRGGLRRDHPFTKVLFQIPTERLRALVAKDKEKEKAKRIQIENEETRERLKKLAKAASKFIQDKVEEIEDLTNGLDKTELKEFAKLGVLILPPSYNLGVNEIKTFGFRAKRKEGISERETAKVTCDDEGVRVITLEFLLSKSPTSEAILTGSFKVQGVQPTDSAIITVSYDGFPDAEAIVSVVESKTEDIDIPDGLAFERELYHVREGRKKQLVLRAKYPEVVSDETIVGVHCDCEDIVIVKPQARLRPIQGTNYAEGYVTIHGRRLKAKGKITASVHGRSAQTEVKVIQSKPDEGIPLSFEIVSESFGASRARWDTPSNPNKLLISATHPSIKRYLGPPPDFEGQNTPHFRLLLAEIVSENIVYKIQEALAKQKPREYENLDIGQFYALHSKYMAEFTVIAHGVQLTNIELESLKY